MLSGRAIIDSVSRALLLVPALVALSLLASACGGSSSRRTAATAPSSANVEGNGSPGFHADMPGVDTQSPQVLGAIGKCQHLVPGYANAPRGTYP